MGFRLDEDEDHGDGEGIWMTHIVWADNIFLIATSAEQAMDMVKDLTDINWGAGFRWKQSPLGALFSPGLPRQDLTVPVWGSIV